jgi:hypothetical protein
MPDFSHEAEGGVHSSHVPLQMFGSHVRDILLQSDSFSGAIGSQVKHTSVYKHQMLSKYHVKGRETVSRRKGLAQDHTAC